MNELKEIMEKFASCGWNLICGPAQQWINGEADTQCGSCGCEFDALYKRALELL